MNNEMYNFIWKNGICVRANQLIDKYNADIYFNRDTQLSIFEEYERLASYSKVNFMYNQKGLLDRHKVAACIMISIVKCQPILYKHRFVNHKDYYNNLYDLHKNKERPILNEELAISIALSIQRFYLVSEDPNNEACISTEKDKKEKEDQLKENQRIFKEGFSFPEVNESYNANYNELLAIMLHKDVEDDRFSILAIANILFLIEEYTRLKDTNKKILDLEEILKENESLIEKKEKELDEKQKVIEDLLERIPE